MGGGYGTPKQNPYQNKSGISIFQNTAHWNTYSLYSSSLIGQYYHAEMSEVYLNSPDLFPYYFKRRHSIKEYRSHTLMTSLAYVHTALNPRHCPKAWSSKEETAVQGGPLHSVALVWIWNTCIKILLWWLNRNSFFHSSKSNASM